GAQPSPDGRRGLIAYLLRDDRLQQPGETGRTASPGQRTGASKDAGQIGVQRRQRIKCKAGRGGRVRELHTRLLSAQPARVTRPVCGSMVNFAITEPSCVASEKPIA